MRLLALAALAGCAGCQIPVRDNPRDPAEAPQVQVRLLVNGADVAAIERGDDARVEVLISDPQLETADVTVTLVDARTPEELAAGNCPAFATLLVAEQEDVSIATFPLAIPAANACFEETGDRPLRLRVTATHKNTRGDGELVFRLVNSAPVADAGPDIFRDAAVDGPVRLEALRSFDDDGDPLTFTWRAPDGTSLPSDSAGGVDVTVAGGGIHERFTLDVCDPWGACTASTVDVFRRRATWVLAADGLAQLDSTWSETRSFVTGTASLPVECDTRVASAPGGFWTFRSGDMFFRRLSTDGRVLTTVPSSGGYLSFFFEQSPDEGTAWTWGNGGEIQRVGPGDEAQVVAVSIDAASYVRSIARDATNGVTWVASQQPFAGGALLARVPDAGLTEELDLSSCAELGGVVRELRTASVGTDGRAYVVATGSAAEAGDATVSVVNGTAIESCASIALPETPIDAVWAAGGLVMAFESGALVRLDLASGQVTEGPQFPITEFSGGGLFYRPADADVLAMGQAGIVTLDPATLAILEALPVTLTGDLPFGDVSTGIDEDGQPWTFSSPTGGCTTGVQGHMIRVPRDFKLVRAHVTGVEVPAAGAASVDPRDGRLWVAQRDPSTGGWVAVAFDERGESPLAGSRIDLGSSEEPFELFFDEGRDVRTPAFWVASVTSDGAMTRIRRITIDGDEEANVVVEGDALSPALDPVTGDFWSTGGFGHDVRKVSAATGSLATRSELGTFNDRDIVNQPNGTVDGSGRYWSAGADALVRVDADLQGSITVYDDTMIGLCNDQTGNQIEHATGAFFDEATGTIAVECRFQYLDGVPSEVERPIGGAARVTVDGAYLGRTRVTPVPGPGAMLHPDGTVWMIDGQLRLRIFDRNNVETIGRSLSFVPRAPVRH